MIGRTLGGSLGYHGKKHGCAVNHLDYGGPSPIYVSHSCWPFHNPHDIIQIQLRLARNQEPETSQEPGAFFKILATTVSSNTVRRQLAAVPDTRLPDKHAAASVRAAARAGTTAAGLWRTTQTG